MHRNGDVITSKGRKEVKDKGVICFRNWQQTAGTMESRLNQASVAELNKNQNEPEQTKEKPDEKKKDGD